MKEERVILFPNCQINIPPDPTHCRTLFRYCAVKQWCGTHAHVVIPGHSRSETTIRCVRTDPKPQVWGGQAIQHSTTYLSSTQVIWRIVAVKAFVAQGLW